MRIPEYSPRDHFETDLTYAWVDCSANAQTVFSLHFAAAVADRRCFAGFAVTSKQPQTSHLPSASLTLKYAARGYHAAGQTESLVRSQGGEMYREREAWRVDLEEMERMSKS